MQYGVPRHKASKDIMAVLDLVARTRSSRETVFRDWLAMMTCALTAGQMEDEYLRTVGRYTETSHGKRGVDHLAECWGKLLVHYTQHPFDDILGDLFQGGITYGEHGQFFTPPEICALMVRMVDFDHAKADEESGTIAFDQDKPLRICEPCCGSGRMVLEYAKWAKRPCIFTCVDMDARCAMMCAINLALHNQYGWVIHGNTLSLECWGGWKVGRSTPWGAYLTPLTKDDAKKTLTTVQEATVAAPEEVPETTPATPEPQKIPA